MHVDGSKFERQKESIFTRNIPNSRKLFGKLAGGNKMYGGFLFYGHAFA
jgi:hypothetical protein